MGAKTDLIALSLVHAHVEARDGKLINVKEYNNKIVKHIGMADNALAGRQFLAHRVGASNAGDAFKLARESLNAARHHINNGDHDSAAKSLANAHAHLSHNDDAAHHLSGVTEDGASIRDHLVAAHNMATQAAVHHDTAKLMASQKASADADKATLEAEKHNNIPNHIAAAEAHGKAANLAHDAGRDAAAQNHVKGNKMHTASAEGMQRARRAASEHSNPFQKLHDDMAAGKHGADAKAATDKYDGKFAKSANSSGVEHLRSLPPGSHPLPSGWMLHKHQTPDGGTRYGVEHKGIGEAKMLPGAEAAHSYLMKNNGPAMTTDQIKAIGGKFAGGRDKPGVAPDFTRAPGKGSAVDALKQKLAGMDKDAATKKKLMSMDEYKAMAQHSESVAAANQSLRDSADTKTRHQSGADLRATAKGHPDLVMRESAKAEIARRKHISG